MDLAVSIKENVRHCHCSVAETLNSHVGNITFLNVLSKYKFKNGKCEVQLGHFV